MTRLFLELVMVMVLAALIAVRPLLWQMWDKLQESKGVNQ